MNHLVTTAILVTAGSSVLTLGFAPTDLSPSGEALVVDAQCTRTCQGDFPAPTNRKYAEATESRPWSRS